MANDATTTSETNEHATSVQEKLDAASANGLAQTPLKKFFSAAVKHEASDIHLQGGKVPRVRIKSELRALGSDPLDEDEFATWVSEALTPGQAEQLSAKGGVDLAFELDSGHRFRVNLFKTRGHPAIAARLVSNVILSAEELHLPQAFEKIADVRQGMVLVAGVTGSGKSTSLAAMIDSINKSRACHIVTIEDPIEYLFEDDKAVISQREVGIDVPSFAEGLRALVREDPDVVLIGEMRDKTTFEAALQAAETGHLVFCTIHASSASQAFSRIYDLFNENERPLVRNLLAYQMQAFICQKLLPTIRDDVANVPAVEILLQSPTTRKYIQEQRESELDEVIKANREAGMQTMTDSLVDLVKREYIHPKTAMAAGASPDEVKMRLRGIENR